MGTFALLCTDCTPPVSNPFCLFAITLQTENEQASPEHAPAAGAATTRAASIALGDEDFDFDASSHELEDLLRMKEEQSLIFSKLNFIHCKAEVFKQLFPVASGQLIPPRGYRISGSTISEWNNMSRAEQDKYKERAKKAQERQERSAKRTGSMVPLGAMQIKDARLTKNETALTLIGAPMAPPLSQPIDFLNGKLTHVKLYYSQVPEGFTAWTNNSAVQKAFPPPRGYSTLQMPQCILQDAVTDQDKLTVLSWWRFLTKEEQKSQLEEMKRVYATPRMSNRKLPADFWEKIREKISKPPANKKREPVDPTGNDFYVRRAKKKEREANPPSPKDMSCKGWSGEKYDGLFQACYAEATKNVSMKDGAKPLDSVPVSESVTRSKHSTEIVFVRDGDDYVLRSTGCTRTRKEASKLCESCQGATSVVGHLKKQAEKSGEVETKLKEQLSALKKELKATQRREKRLREKLSKDPNSTSLEPTPKNQRASELSPKSSPRHPMASVVHENHGYAQQNNDSTYSYGY